MVVCRPDRGQECLDMEYIICPLAKLEYAGEHEAGHTFKALCKFQCPSPEEDVEIGIICPVPGNDDGFMKITR